jgi:hypothetical protein
MAWLASGKRRGNMQDIPTTGNRIRPSLIGRQIGFNQLDTGRGNAGLTQSLFDLTLTRQRSDRTAHLIPLTKQFSDTVLGNEPAGTRNQNTIPAHV